MPKKPASKSRAAKGAGTANAKPSAPPRLAAIREAAAKLPKLPSTLRTYFLLLSRDELNGRRFVQLRAPSVLAWFQRTWSGGPSWKSELGGYVYGLGKLFDAIDEDKLSRPGTDQELGPLLKKHIYYERSIDVEPHFVHVETDDDEVKVEYFFFDDEFLKTAGALDRLPPAHLDADAENDAYAALLVERPA